jgi:hypothetical protein
MSIYPNGEFRKPLSIAHTLADIGIPIFCCKMDEDGNPHPPSEWEMTNSGEDSHNAIERWKPGMALCAVCGVVFDVVDIDPRNGGLKSWPEFLDALDDGPWIFGISETPSRGAHLWIPAQGMAKAKLAAGIDYQAGADDGSGRGFVFIPPTSRPSKAKEDDGELRPYLWRQEIPWHSTPWTHPASESLARVLAEGVRSNGSSTRSSGRRSAEELERLALEAPDGLQRDALLALVQELQWSGLTDEAVRIRMREFLPTLPVYPSKKGPWYPAKRSRPDYWINGLLLDAGSFVADPTDDELRELAGIAGIQPKREADPEEEAFWASRPVLAHIQKWAQARRAAPWAVLGEAMAEAICHTPPGLRLPPGDGTLNMLVAVVGKSGAGKNVAMKAARNALQWHGVVGLVENSVSRIPIGSGEGISRSFGYTRKDKDTGEQVMSRSCYSAIFTIPEIDTFTAINGRPGATISPELRKLYSGEDLGFNWADPTRKVIIPEHSYRACVIAGVQPGRGEAILGDIEGGFAQRWLWLPAVDIYAPDVKPGEPYPIVWNPPGPISSLSSEDEKYVMKVCDVALDTIDSERISTLRDMAGEDIQSQEMYTRLKVAAALALLDGSETVREEDWELSAFVMEISRRTRLTIEGHLAKKAHQAIIAGGRSDAIRETAKQATIVRTENTRVAGNVIKQLKKAGDWVSYGKLKNSIAYKDREALPEAIRALLELKRIECEEIMYNNQKGRKYRIKSMETT